MERDERIRVLPATLAAVTGFIQETL
jgi:hypothetical protein